MANCAAASEVVDRGRIIAHLPGDQTDVTKRLSFFEPVSQLSFERQGAAEVVHIFWIVSETFIAIADQAQGDGFSPLITHFSEEREGTFKFWESCARSLLCIDLS